MPSLEKSYKALSKRIRIIAFGALLSLLGIAGISIWQDYENTLSWTKTHTLTMAQNLAEHTARSLDAVDLTLLTVKKQAERDRTSQPRSAETIIQEFETYIASLPQIRGMILTDGKGIIRYTERKKSIGMDIHDRGYFKLHQKSTTDDLYIGKPLKGRTTGNWFFSTSRKVQKPDGSFDGITMALVRQEYFKDYYDRVEQEQNISSAYVTAKGLVFAASDNFSESVNDIAGKEISIDPSHRADSRLLKFFETDEERIAGYAQVEDLPIFMVTSIPLSVALIPWKKRSSLIALLVTGASLILLWLTLALINHFSKRAEAEKLLQKSEQRFRDVVNSASDWVWEIDKDFKFTYLSDRFQTITGISPGEVIGKDRLQFIPEDKRDEHKKVLDAHQAFRNFTYATNMGTETLRHLKASGTPIIDEEGVFQGYRGTATDISAEIKHAEEREKLQDQLRHSQKMETVGTLAGGIAHDFNNMLNPIMVYSELLSHKLPAESREKSQAEAINQAAHRATDLVRQILTMSSQNETEMQPTLLEPIVKEVSKLIRAVTPTTIEILSDIDPTCRPVMADPVKVHQTIMNLSINATHAMDKDGGTLTLKLDEFNPDNETLKNHLGLENHTYVRLSISDTGHGMDKETRERIFEPFFTTKEKGKGTGLGLATVHGIVESHNGHISVYSEVDQGTTFQIFLPVIKSLENAAISKPKIYKGNAEHILIVDDELVNVKVLKEILENLNYNVTSFSHPEKALKAYKENPADFDCIITDQTMPNILGSELAKEVLDLNPDANLILVTGFNSKIGPERAKEIGIKDYLMKPVTTAGISKILHDVLNR